jgi:hypothetical protein
MKITHKQLVDVVFFFLMVAELSRRSECQPTALLRAAVLVRGRLVLSPGLSQDLLTGELCGTSGARVGCNVGTQVCKRRKVNCSTWIMAHRAKAKFIS